MMGMVTLLMSIAALFEANPVEQQRRFERIYAFHGAPSHTGYEAVASDDSDSDTEEDKEYRKADTKKKR